MINNIVHRLLGRAGITATKEPSGLLAGSSLRPDGTTLIPWTRGKYLAWDATTPDTLCMSHLSATSNSTGAAAAHSAVLKGKKYNRASPIFHFVAIATETMGPWNVEGLDVVRELGMRTALVTNDPRETNFLL